MNTIRQVTKGGYYLTYRWTILPSALWHKRREVSTLQMDYTAFSPVTQKEGSVYITDGLYCLQPCDTKGGKCLHYRWTILPSALWHKRREVSTLQMNYTAFSPVTQKEGIIYIRDGLYCLQHSVTKGGKCLHYRWTILPSALWHKRREVSTLQMNYTAFSMVWGIKHYTCTRNFKLQFQL